MDELILLVDREEVVAEAVSWRGTPYHLGGRLKGGKGCGVDCGTYLTEVLVRSGLATRGEMDELLAEVGFYSHDWFCHETSDPSRYLRMMLRYARLVSEGVMYPSTQTDPGNFALSKVVGSKYYNHGGIITKWPRVMHCIKDSGVNEVDATTDSLWCPQQIAIFNPWERP